MSLSLIDSFVPLSRASHSIRGDSRLFHLFEMNVFSFLDDKLLSCQDRLVVVSRSVFLLVRLVVLIAISVIFSLVVLRIVVLGHQGWFECAMV